VCGWGGGAGCLTIGGGRDLEDLAAGSGGEALEWAQAGADALEKAAVVRAEQLALDEARGREQAGARERGDRLGGEGVVGLVVRVVGGGGIPFDDDDVHALEQVGADLHAAGGGVALQAEQELGERGGCAEAMRRRGGGGEGGAGGGEVGCHRGRGCGRGWSVLISSSGCGRGGRGGGSR
jgi:hypothetical protein